MWGLLKGGAGLELRLTLNGDALEASGVSSAEHDRLTDLGVCCHGTGG
jgi:hypothetical protein